MIPSVAATGQRTQQQQRWTFFQSLLLTLMLLLHLHNTAGGAAVSWSWLSPTTSLLDQPGEWPPQSSNIGGSSSTASPPARGHAAIAILNNTLIIIGGVGHGSSGASNELLNDVWTYDLISMNWTWIRGCNHGSTSPYYYGIQTVTSNDNELPPRTDASFTSDGHRMIYIYSGVAWASSSSSSGLTERTTPNDMWSIDVVTQQWTWLHGSWSSSPVSYGTLLTESLSNTPGSRQSSAMTMMKHDHSIWLFGGLLNNTFTNDFWRFNTTTNQWTCLFIGGTTTNYGTRGVMDTNNIPPARAGHGMDMDGNGNIWIIGGLTSSSELLNDVWKWSTKWNAFEWVAGSSLSGVPSGWSYGIIGVASSSNLPSARLGSTIQLDHNGEIIYQYGGYGYDQTTQTFGYLADMWSFNTTSNWFTWLGGSSEMLSVGNRGELSNDTWPGISFDHGMVVDDVDNLLLFGNTIGPTNLLFSMGPYLAPCAIGQTRLTRDSSSCTLCASGRYTSRIGTMGPCSLCTSGSYCPGNSAPISCGIGSVSPIGSSMADDCTCNGITYVGSNGKDQCSPVGAVSSSSSTGEAFPNVTVVDSKCFHFCAALPIKCGRLMKCACYQIIADGVDSVLLLLTLSQLSPSAAIDGDQRTVLRNGIVLDLMTLLDISSTWIRVVSIMAAPSSVTMLVAIEMPPSTSSTIATMNVRTPAQLAEAFVILYQTTFSNSSSQMARGLVTSYQSSSISPMMLLAWDDGAYQAIQSKKMPLTIDFIYRHAYV
jgi:hypothetical protein